MCVRVCVCVHPCMSFPLPLLACNLLSFALLHLRLVSQDCVCVCVLGSGVEEVIEG